MTTIFQKLLDHFNRFPGIGPKTSEKFVWHILKQPKENIEKLSNDLIEFTNRVRLCSQCFFIAEDCFCKICSDSKRDQTTICVVTDPSDVNAIERTGSYNGLYHVLGDVIDHLRGIGPERLHIPDLMKRITSKKISEVILATNPDIPGESTALTLSHQLSPLRIKITRIARGLPLGSDLDYADEITLSSAILGRKIMNQKVKSG